MLLDFSDRTRTGISKLISRLNESPIQVLTELNVAWLQWLYENWYFQVDVAEIVKIRVTILTIIPGG